MKIISKLVEKEAVLLLKRAPGGHRAKIIKRPNNKSNFFLNLSILIFPVFSGLSVVKYFKRSCGDPTARS